MTLDDSDPSASELRSGDLFERTFVTSRGPIDFLAEVVVEGQTLTLRDVAIFGRSPTPLSGLSREVFGARTQLAAEVRARGFRTLRITGRRVASSSSGNPGHPIDLTIDLTR